MVRDEDYRAYQMVMAYLEKCPTGVRVFGIVINNRLLATQATRSLIGIPTFYHMVNAAMTHHSHGSATPTPPASLAGAYMQT